MDKSKIKNTTFIQGLNKLGFDKDDDSLIFNDTSTTELPEQQILFYLEKAKAFSATAVYLRKQLTGSYKPQVYLYDFTDRTFNNENQNELTEIQKKIWSSGEAPLACIFYSTEIKILNCSTHIKDNNSPVYLIDNLKITDEAHTLYNEQFALKIKSGVFWDEEINKDQFNFSNSAYDVLIKWIRKINEVLSQKHKKIERVINKIIVQSILIKYLEERKDEEGRGLFREKYFEQFAKAKNFADVLRTKGKFVILLRKLHNDFNGNLFEWNEDEKKIINSVSLDILADALEGKSSSEGQLLFDFIKYYEFNYVPVELISRLYEEFLGESKKEEGLYYTPSHLAKLLVDEAMPLRNYDKIDLNNFRILDPACGSGIFLVIAFKRLVQWWRLQNGIYKKRNVEDLKKLLRCVYGIDKERQATQLAAFSLCLALCDELSPKQIISDLTFDDLTQTNILFTDFFVNDLKEKNLKGKIKDDVELQIGNFKKLNNIEFDLVIGNSPFVRGGTTEYNNNIWKIENDIVEIPNGQIALKFLSNSYTYLKPGGLQCLIIKSTSLLYGSSSDKYREFLLSKLNVSQIFDFTALAENKSLWDNGARVGAAAIFLKNEKPDFSKNILHLTFRRTKATRERIVFEIDNYDLHFVNRRTAIENKFIWKINLLGGGRIKNIIEKLLYFSTFKDFLINNNCTIQEGHGKLKSNSPKPTSLKYRLDSKDGIIVNKIQFESIRPIPVQDRKKIKDLLVYHSPNIIISETINIEEGEIKIALNLKDDFVFKNRYVGIASKTKDQKLLRTIFNNFLHNNYLYILQIFVKSAQAFINRNTAILAYDLYNLRYLTDQNNLISNYDFNISIDVIKYLQEFLRIGEKAKAVWPISKDEFDPFIKHFGKEFSSVLNLVYENRVKKFRLSDVIRLNNNFIATIFKYDSISEKPIFHYNNSKLNLKYLTNLEISKHLTANRIIKLYPDQDTIVFIKPNQYRYWLSLIAYRDADKCFADLSALGY